MNILWVTNVELSAIANAYGDKVVVGGWLEQTAALLAGREGIELFIACNSKRGYFGQKAEGITFFAFENKNKKRLKQQIRKIIDYVEPDVVHIWGTEYIHSLEFVKYSAEKGIIDKLVVSIQGLVSIYPIHYFANIPERVIHHRTLKEFVKPNIYRAKEVMKANGENEKQALKIARNCMGRTDWDFACVKQMNDDIVYYSVGEILRAPFYSSRVWEYDACSRHTIFFSQASYPIKGFHTMLQALQLIKEKYPDVKLKVLGQDPSNKTLKQRLKRGSYERYIMEMVSKLELREHVQWLGTLDSEEMVRQYLEANVFASSSSIENSSNSIGEAMMLGVPIVASDVGGIKSFMTHEKEGILFHDEAYYMLADAVCRLFSDVELASQLGENARMRALNTHDKASNMNKMLTVYDNLYRGHRL